jgi:broad specificity phosphatase PhoE
MRAWFAALCAAMAMHGAAATPSPSSDDAKLWRALQDGGYVLLLRHMQTVPGTGDPPNFKLRDCATQRNLDDVGRAQAKRWHALMRQGNVPLAAVYASQWCRCIDSANIAFGKLARVDTWPALNSHFDTPQTADIQRAQVLGGLGVRMRPKQNIVLVTHQVNITALTGEFTSMGEAVVARFEANQLKPIGRLRLSGLSAASGASE